MQKCQILISSMEKNVQFFLIFTYDHGKIFLILHITRGGGGGTYIPSLHWELPPPLDIGIHKGTLNHDTIWTFKLI